MEIINDRRINQQIIGNGVYGSELASHKNIVIIGLLLALCATGCDNNMSNSVNLKKIEPADWNAISVGMEKQAVLRILGQPDTIQESEILGVKTEQLVYTEYLPEKYFQIDLVVNRVVAKKSENQTTLLSR